MLSEPISSEGKGSANVNEETSKFPTLYLHFLANTNLFANLVEFVNINRSNLARFPLSLDKDFNVLLEGLPSGLSRRLIATLLKEDTRILN